MSSNLRSAHCSEVTIVYEESGNPDGWPVILLHGFPYDVRSFDEVVKRCTSVGARVIVPYIRGFGPTRYRGARVMRSGQQAALGNDVRELIAALRLDRPVIAGYDWGGRAACVVSALWPELVRGLVTSGGYNIHDIAEMTVTPSHPESERRVWYQWYFHSERGRAGLEQYRDELARQLWAEWSPTWLVPEGAFEATAPSFANPDFVATVVHSYRHRYGLAPGAPQHQEVERELARNPRITVPTVVIDPLDDPIQAARPLSEHARMIVELVDHWSVRTGHNSPQEDPVAFAKAIELLR